eukprot:15430298-Heterocapsa_arctica.AAC.1
MRAGALHTILTDGVWTPKQEQTNHSFFNGDQVRKKARAKAKHIQAHKRDKRNKAKNKGPVTEEEELSEAPDSSTDTHRINHHHVVENRRKQSQGYLDQKEDREI